MTTDSNSRQLGFWLTSAIVVGTIIGSGIFLLPVSLAPLGANAPIAWVVSGVGAMCIAFALSKIVRPEGGGLQSYVEAELGATAGFIVAFALWVSSWTSVAATGIAAAAALSRIFPNVSDANSVALIAIVITVLITVVNLRGAKTAGEFALITVAIRILPLLAVIAVVFIRHSNHQALSPLAPAPVTGNKIATAVTLTLFAIIGFENGTAPVGKVRNPCRTIPLALLAGTAFCVVLYLFSSTAVSMILSPQAAQTSLAPYADALKANWGEGAADLAAAGISIAAIGGLNSNLLCGGELGYSMALRGDLPNRLARTRGANTPVNSLVLVALLAIVLVLFNTSKSTANLFMFVILLTTTATLVVYVVGAVAALKKRVSVPASIAIITAILFSLFAFYGAGLEANLWGLVLLIAGLAIRWLCHRINSRAGSSLAAEASPAAPAE